MLRQTNSYVVPARQRAEHARLLGRFRKALARVGCDLFEIYEQADAKWDSLPGDARFVQIIRFRDRQHQRGVREAERLDLEAQSLIEEFCQLINFPYQQEHGLFAVGFYNELKYAPEQPKAQTIDAVEQELDDLMGEFGDPRALLAAEDNDLARVLDAGLAFDDLDTPMEAELLDEPTLDEPAVEVRPLSPRRPTR